MKLIATFFVLSLGAGAFAFGQEDYQLEGRCQGSGGQYIRNGRDGKDIKKSLVTIARKAGVKLHVYSCFRSQDNQNAILKSRGCAPYGSANCSQSVARTSQHTTSIAADIKKFAEPRKQCNDIAEGRRDQNGMGGVGTYPRGDGHFDVGSNRSWNLCKGIVGPAKGYSSKAVDNYKQRRGSSGSSGSSSASRSCYPTRSFPNCCGPIRAGRGLCRM